MNRTLAFIATATIFSLAMVQNASAEIRRLTCTPVSPSAVTNYTIILDLNYNNNTVTMQFNRNGQDNNNSYNAIVSDTEVIFRGQYYNYKLERYTGKFTQTSNTITHLEPYGRDSYQTDTWSCARGEPVG